MATELRSTILEADDIPEEIVDVPEWGVKVLVRGMDGKTRAKFLKTVATGGQVDIERFTADLVIATTHDPDDRMVLFDPADRDTLNKKSGAALDRIAKRAMVLSGIATDAVEAAEKDLDDTPKSAST